MHCLLIKKIAIQFLRHAVYGPIFYGYSCIWGCVGILSVCYIYCIRCIVLYANATPFPVGEKLEFVTFFEERYDSVCLKNKYSESLKTKKVIGSSSVVNIDRFCFVS